MKKLLLTFATVMVAVAVNAADATWLTSLPEAQAKAKAENKLVLIDFTGSDWCPPCKALHKNVLATKEFEDYAAKSLVLVELDFPRKKEQSEELKKTNRALAKKFEIEGYPTIIVLDASGKELHRAVGYSGADAKEYVAELKKVGN